MSSKILMNFEDISSITDPDSFEYYENQYDLKNRLKAVKKYLIVDDAFVIKTSSYSYDIDGFRIEIKGPDGSTMRYIFDRDGKVLEYIDLVNNEVTSSVYLKSRHLAQVTSEETLFYGTDHQGTTVLVTNADGEKIWTSEATPFGDAVVRKTGERDDLSLKYTGKDLDEDTGLYYYNARWYDAGTGRFISEDPARDSSNWYISVSNSPLNYIDPTGLEKYTFSGSSTFITVAPNEYQPATSNLFSVTVRTEVTIDPEAGTINVTSYTSMDVYDQYTTSSASTATLNASGLSIDSDYLAPENATPSIMSENTGVLGGANFNLPIDSEAMDLSITTSTSYQVQSDNGWWELRFSKCYS